MELGKKVKYEPLVEAVLPKIGEFSIKLSAFEIFLLYLKEMSKVCKYEHRSALAVLVAARNVFAQRGRSCAYTYEGGFNPPPPSVG
jgi:hypothetical protein